MRPLILFLLFTTSLFAKEVIVFDFGGVVGKVNRRPILQQMATQLNLPYKQVKKALDGQRLYEAMDSSHAYWHQFAHEHGAVLPPNFMENLQRYRIALVTRVPGTAQIIDDLKADGYRVALLSNTKQDRANFLRAQGYYKPFDPVLVSCEIGTKKPLNPAYQELIQQVNTTPGNIIFIDNKRSNIHAARRNGITGIHFTSAPQLRQDLVNRKIL